mgnify:FL=1
MKNTIKVVKKDKNNITVVIHPTPYNDYDILGLGDVTLLRHLSHKNEWFHLIKKSKYGGIPICILDTTDTLRDAMSCVKEYRKLFDK